MVKKYSPTVDSNSKPIMKIDNDGHFVHLDDFDKVVDLLEDVANKLENVDPSVFTQMRLAILLQLKKDTKLLK